MFELRPSGAGAWSRCAGYPRLNATIGATGELIERDNEVREDGLAWHWLAKTCWDDIPPQIGEYAPNGRELTEEMFAAVDEYHALLKSFGGTPVLEQMVPCSRAFPGVSDGTPDAYCVVGYTLHLPDGKFGFRPVEVWRNPQLMIYAWTLVTQMFPNVTEIVMYIYQPRFAHHEGTTRSWRVTRDELVEEVKYLFAAAARCHAPNPLCTPGPYCRDCDAAHACKTLQAAAGAAREAAYDSVTHILTPEQLAYELARLMAAETAIEHRITGMMVQAESLTKRGTRVPGFDMVRSGTHWRWREGSHALVRRLGTMFSVEVDAPVKLKTVAKLREAFPFDVQSMYAEKPTGELRLKLTDPNEAIKRFTSRK